jgi:hypothetical protein
VSLSVQPLLNARTLMVRVTLLENGAE